MKLKEFAIIAGVAVLMFYTIISANKIGDHFACKTATANIEQMKVAGGLCDAATKCYFNMQDYEKLVAEAARAKEKCRP